MSVQEKKIDDIYQQITPQTELLYRFVLQEYSVIVMHKDYEWLSPNPLPIPLTSVEVHTLTMIEDNPGITISEVAVKWDRTKSTVSENIKKLEQKKLIYRVQDEKDAKIKRLYLTERGLEISRAHKAADCQGILTMNQTILERCSQEDLNTFYRVMEIYYQVRSEQFEAAQAAMKK